ncbi:hypothetical protein N475_09350 [Pseudoalteromonas luteoviolacea DSM 6061]|uniref:Uncharacterized protein n=1 Tax=Pseudoalteromonas luteoviolacea DSM 6061 TaxID=1365250 RepID=A0A166YRI4_9GAMM|nr:hypothetical protein N475_09350 [Pseudoalteromonas luteoviolacea DSM 6061]MBE0385433.1 hypothetical protein [Pseudoalteromonas luteoviolacea DSM 6061]
MVIFFGKKSLQVNNDIYYFLLFLILELELYFGLPSQALAYLLF